MVQRLIVVSLLSLVCLLFAGCVTAIDASLPYPELPQITLATEVRLVADPAHPMAYLAANPAPAGTAVEVLGANRDAAWLLVRHETTLGWMPTIFSRDNLGSLKAALVIKPLDTQCTQYHGDATAAEKIWTITEPGAAIVQGAIYRPELTEQFSDATLTLNVDGSGAVVAGDYVHTQLTPSSAVILFTFAVEDLAAESRLHFTLNNTNEESLSFQAALFSNSCPDAINPQNSRFLNELPIGQTKQLDETQVLPTVSAGAVLATSEAVSTTSSATESTGSDGTSSATTNTINVQGEVLLAILSTRTGPSFDYPANGRRLQGDEFRILARVCSETGDYEWYLIGREGAEEQWVPGLPAFVMVTNVDTLICLPPPPIPAPDPNSATIAIANDTTAKIVTDSAAFAPYLMAIGDFRLAEKVALALPDSPAVRQLTDYAQGRALMAIQDAVRRLRTQRAITQLAVDELTIQLAVTFNDGTVSVLTQESQSQSTQRAVAVGNETIADEVYRGAVLYAIRYRNGRWIVQEIVRLGTSGTAEIVEAVARPESATAIDEAILARITTLLAAKDLHTIGSAPPATAIDPSAFVRPESNVIEGRIAVNTRLTAESSPYLIQGEVTVNNGISLLIEPGAIVKFNDDSYFNIDGVLIARGTPTEQIIFTSSKDDLAGGDTNGDGSGSAPAPGDWTMIRFRDTSNDVNSIVEYATIRYAGEYRGDGYGAIHLEAASPTIVNNLFEDNYSYVINSDVVSFPLVGGNRLARNGGNGLLIREGQLASNGVWRNVDIPYAIFRPITVREGATLSVDPGVVVKFGDDAYIDVYGAFKATGTVDDPVIFTSIKDDTVLGDTNGDEASTSPAPGDWTMIRFYDASNDANSLIDHAIIRYAGQHRNGNFGAIHLEAAAPTISNSTFTENFAYAISGDVHSYPTVNGNTLQRNGGNGYEVRPGNMSVGGIWRNTDIVYTIPGVVTLNEGTTLNVEPGVVVKFAKDAYIDIYGAFRALGTPETPITFTSFRDDNLLGDTNGDQGATTPTAGDWTMLRFRDSSNDANSTIEHAVIRYAGQNRNTPFGAVHLEAASPTIINNSFSDNWSFAVSADVNAYPTVSGNELTGNGGNGLEIRTGNLAVNGVWRNTDIPYVLLGPVTVNDGAMLTIDPGVVVKLNKDAYFEVNGAFRALGTADAPITFTSLRDDSVNGDTNGDQNSSIPSPGDWTYIGFNDSSNDTNSIVEHAVIRYAGLWRNEVYGAIHLESASPTLTNNTIEQSNGYAISGDANAFPTVSGNQLANNVGNALLIRAGRMTVGGTWANTDIPYTVLGELAINEGVLLTIDPGVTVKFGDDAYIDIYGAFKAIGSADAPITFTSLRDDTVGGDTNGDGASTAPTPGDWTYIGFKNSSNDVNSRIEYATIRYAGENRNRLYGAIHLEGASPTLVNNTIMESFAYGIWHDVNSEPVLEDNTFSNNREGDVVAAE